MNTNVKILIGILFWFGCGLYQCWLERKKSGNDWVFVFVNLTLGPIKLMCYLIWYHIF